MVNILSNGYRVLNPIAPNGVAVAGSPGSGTISQYNNNQVDTVSAGDASSDGSVKKVIATDANDTVNLGSGWTSAGTATDQTTGITGTLYTSSSGDQLLISGGSKVNQPPPAPAPAPAQAPAATPAPAPANTVSQTLSVDKPAATVSQRPAAQTRKINYATLAALASSLYPISHSSANTSSWYTTRYSPSRVIPAYNYAKMNASYFGYSY